MKYFIAISILFITTVSMADTYIYRVPVSRITRTNLLDIGKNIGRGGRIQPYFGTYVLLQPDTNYYLLKVTPKIEVNPNLDRIHNIDLYQIQRLGDDGFIKKIVDNSKIFSTSNTWVKRHP